MAVEQHEKSQLDLHTTADCDPRPSQPLEGDSKANEDEGEQASDGDERARLGNRDLAEGVRNEDVENKLPASGAQETVGGNLFVFVCVVWPCTWQLGS